MKRWLALALLVILLPTLALADYRGDFPPDSVLNFKFSTVATQTGLNSTLAGSPGAACYKDGATSPTTNSVSVLPDFNSIVGWNNLRIDTSGNDGFFSEGSSFDCVITAGTVGGTSVVGQRILSFSIARNTANLWQIRTATASATSGVLAVNTTQFGGSALTQSGGIPSVNTTQIAGAAVSTTTAQIGVNVVNWRGTDAASTNVDTNVQRLAGTDVRATRFQANTLQWNSTDVISTRVAVNVAEWNYAGNATIATVNIVNAWDVRLVDHLNAGSTGLALNSAGAAGDPWSTALPGAYADGTAGAILGKSLATPIAANVTQISGAAVNTSTAQLGVNLVNIAGAAVSTTTAQLGVNVVNWKGTDAASTNVDVNVQRIAGTDVRATRAQANVVQWNGTDTISTRVNANVTQWNTVDVISTSVNANTTQIAGAAVSTSTAQIGVNLVNVAGAAVNTSAAQLGVNVVNWRQTDAASTNVSANVLAWRGSQPNTLTNGRVAGTSFAPRNTALAGFQFVVTDDTTHTPTAGLAIECTRSIDGGGFAAGTLTATASVSNGVYSIDFGAGDLAGANTMLRCTAPGADDTLVTITTTP